MKKCAKRPNAAACACQNVAKKMGATASHPFLLRAVLALLAELSVALTFVYMRQRMKDRGAM